MNVPTAVFDVCDFGAKGDGITVQTQAINEAIRRVSESGGEISVFHKGERRCIIFFNTAQSATGHESLYYATEILASYASLARGADYPAALLDEAAKNRRKREIRRSVSKEKGSPCFP